MNLPERFVIPEDRIPKPWSQLPYDCCVAAAITKILEVFEYMKTGKYTMLSKGYMYGRNNKPNKKQGGMDYDYVLPILLERGTVPEDMCPIMDEIPSIVKKLEALPNIKELDKEAEKTKIKGFVEMPGTAKFNETVKHYLYTYQMPMVGDIVRDSHAVVVVGWDGDKFLYHDHKGKDTLYKDKLNKAYYLDGGVDDMKEMKFTDVKETDWFYQAVKCAYDDGVVVGTSDTTFEPNKPLTRAEFCEIYRRMKEEKGV